MFLNQKYVWMCDYIFQASWLTLVKRPICGDKVYLCPHPCEEEEEEEEPRELEEK